MLPLVSIVTLNWNQAEVTCELLDTLEQLTYPRVEVLVVDNGSSGDDVAYIRTRHPWVRLIANAHNEGFTGGNNTGMKAAQGDFIMLLNNDAEVPPGFLEPLVEEMESDPRIGIISPKIRFHHTPDMIQYAGCEAINPYTMRGRTTGFGEIDRGQHDRSRPTALAHGAAMVIRRSVLERIGLLADTFFIYYEEFDFCERARRAGYGIHYVAESVVFHKESISVGKRSVLKTYYMTRNRLLFLRRNTRGMRFLLGMAYVLGVAVPKNTVGLFLERRFDLLRALYRGLAWHLTSLGVHHNPKLAPVQAA